MAIIDIIVPCYRYGHFLPCCIDSIQRQSLKDVRILIIDDASPDSSATVARQIAGSDSRIEVIVHPTNRGHVATFNEGLDWATSRYLLLLSADDFLAPGALARAVDLMNARADVALTYGSVIELQPGQPAPSFVEMPGAVIWTVRPGRDFVAETCASIRNVVPTPTAIVRTAIQHRIGGYRAELHHAGDLEMWLRFAAHGAVASTRSVQACYRLHGDNMSSAFYRTVVPDFVQRQQAFDIFFANEGARLQAADQLHRLARRRLGDAAFWTAAAQIGRGNLQIGRQLLHFAWGLNPDTRLWPPFGHLRHINRPDLRALAAFSDLWATARRLPRQLIAARRPSDRAIDSIPSSNGRGDP